MNTMVIARGVKSFLRRTALRPWIVERKSSSLVYLTFDDGPHPRYTEEVLDALKMHGAKATFFLVANRVVERPDLVARMVREGHEIGNHSATHAEFAELNYDGVVAEFAACDRVLADFSLAGKHHRPPLRPPKGVINLVTLRYSLLQRRPYYLWSRDPEDFSATSAEQVMHYFEKSPIRDGDIVLLHDKMPFSGELVAMILMDLKGRMLETATLSGRN